MLNRLLFVTCGLTVLGLLALHDATPPYTTAQQVVGLLTLPAFVAMSGLILVFLVQPLWPRNKDD